MFKRSRFRGSQTYVGGNFAIAGGAQANMVARWDGTEWAPLGDGLRNGDGAYSDSGVFALATNHAGNLYAGGTFATAGGLTRAAGGERDGNAWSSLGAGLGGSHRFYDGTVVYTLAFDTAGNLFTGARLLLGVKTRPGGMGTPGRASARPTIRSGRSSPTGTHSTPRATSPR